MNPVSTSPALSSSSSVYRLLHSHRFLKYCLVAFMPMVLTRQMLGFFGINLGPYSLPFLLLGLLLAVLSWKNRPRNALVLLMTGFIIYCVISGCLFVFHDVPIRGYLMDLSMYVLPMAFFFIGANNVNTGDDFEKSFVLFCSGFMALGIYAYSTTPAWYVQWLSALSATQRFGTEVLSYQRFSAFWGTSYPVAYLGMSGLCYSFFRLESSSSRLGKGIAVLGIFIFWISCILCQQRASMVCATLVAVAELLYAIVVLKRKLAALLVASVFLIVSCGFLVTVISSSTRTEFIHGRISERLSKMDSAMSERTIQYETMWRNWNSEFVGYGIGSGGEYAYITGHVGIPDGNYVKILYEQGLIGLTWIVAILLASLLRAWKFFLFFRFEAYLICCYCICAIGASAFCNGSGLYAVPLWYAVGRIWNSAELTRRREVIPA